MSDAQICIHHSGSGRVSLIRDFTKKVRDSGFDCSREAGFAKIGHGMRDSDKKESGIRDFH